MAMRIIVAIGGLTALPIIHTGNEERPEFKSKK